MKTTTEKPDRPTVKNIDWSYPTSTNAKRFGFRSGCWSVGRTTFFDRYAVTNAVSGHATIEEARIAAEQLPEAWASWAKNGRIHP